MLKEGEKGQGLRWKKGGSGEGKREEGIRVKGRMERW